MRRAHSGMWIQLNFQRYVYLILAFYVLFFFASASDYQGNMSQRTDHQMLEEENDRMVDHLSSKVQALKSVSQKNYFIQACVRFYIY